ncbi:MAG: efflux RND transporter periplasmic adaptor subunit [Lentisphaeria bacterium]|nr:efflux RND transporter periplasmic adaptor subunit [Lentisphaeria bacterium]
MIRKASITAAAAVTFFAGCATLSAQGMQGPAPTVPVAKTVLVSEQGTKQYIGKLVSTHAVDLKARVSGYLVDVYSKEGDMVKEGDLVMQIEDTLYVAKVKSAEAKVKQKNAELEYARSNFARQKELAGISAKSEMDEANRLLKLREAELAECEAALTEAQTNLSYTKIISPITGRFGKATYSPGNYITTSSDALGSVAKISPIYVKMAISEPDYIRMFGTPERILKDAVIRIRTADRKMFDEEGHVKLADNKIDPRTGTLMLWCIFENKSGRLIPGGVVDAFISRKVTEKFPAIQISAIMQSKQGQFVYVLDGENKAQYRPVTTGEIVGSRQIILSGLKEGETVIVDGTHKVMPGQVVNPVFVKAPGESAAKPAAAPAKSAAPAAAGK